MELHNLTLSDAIMFRNEALEEGTPESNVIASVLSQLIPHLELKIIQITTIDESLIALKSDGTLWTSFGGAGINWKAMPLPK